MLFVCLFKKAKPRLTDSLFGHLQIFLRQISIKIFRRPFENEWLPIHETRVPSAIPLHHFEELFRTIT